MRLLFVIGIVVALAGCAKSAREQPAAAPVALRPAGLVGAWIGLASDGVTYYRLVLEQENTGQCATAAGKEEALYRVREWSVADRSLTIHLELTEGGPDTRQLITLRGTQSPSRLEVVAQDAHTVTFWREKTLLETTDRLAKRMR